MLDRAERLASGHADPQPCVECRSEWSARNRPLHPAELAENLPRPRPGGRWSAVAGALQFAELLEEDAPRLDPATYVTTGSRDTFEEVMRTHGSSPTFSFLLCSLFGDVLGLPQGAYLDFPRPREWRAAAGHYREKSSPRTASARRMMCSDFRIEGSTSYLMSKSSWRTSTRRGRTA